MSNFNTQVGTVENFSTAINDGWFTVTFDPAFPDGQVPQVFAQIQTYNGSNTPSLRLRKITNESFQVTMTEIVGSPCTSETLGNLGRVESDGLHEDETLAWMAAAIS
ncbi:MAG: hypothetical protein Roseis2KO_07690 [Roseivirga sp.]